MEKDIILFLLAKIRIGKVKRYFQVRILKEKTGEVFPGLYVTGMSVCAVFNLPRMGPIFGGMLKSGKKVAELIIDAIGNEKIQSSNT